MKLYRRASNRYTEYYGDGHSKSFTKVQDAYQASGITVEKKECIGHVQKGVGTAFPKLKRKNAGLGGRGELTDGTIGKLQNYHGITFCSSVENLAGMKKAIHASFMYCASSESHLLRNHCPPCSTSWCRCADKANKTRLYKHGPGIPCQLFPS